MSASGPALVQSVFQFGPYIQRLVVEAAYDAGRSTRSETPDLSGTSPCPPGTTVMSNIDRPHRSPSRAAEPEGSQLHHAKDSQAHG